MLRIDLDGNSTLFDAIRVEICQVMDESDSVRSQVLMTIESLEMLSLGGLAANITQQTNKGRLRRYHL